MRRCNGHHVRHRFSGDHLSRHGDDVPRNGLRAGECRGRHGCDRPRRLAVAIDDIGHVRVVVEVIDDRRIDYGVADVDVREVGPADGICGLIDFARPQWEPADSGHRSGRYRQAEAAAADEGDQRRRIDRTHRERTRHPAPPARYKCPAAVVERREAPRRLVDPVPAPGIDPAPMSGTVRHPADRDGGREPDVAVALDIAPSTVLVEIRIADDVGRNVTRAHRRILTPVAIEGPAVEFIRRRQRVDEVIAQAFALERVLLARGDDIRRVFAPGLAFSATHADDGRIAVWVDIDAILAGAPDRESQIRRIDLEHLVGIDAANAQIQSALRNFDLHDAIVEIQDRRARVAAEPRRRTTDLQLGARAGVGPDAVARDQGAIRLRQHPFLLARRREADGAIDLGQARDAPGWVGEYRCAGDERGGAAQSSNPVTKRIPGWGHVSSSVGSLVVCRRFATQKLVPISSVRKHYTVSCMACRAGRYRMRMPTAQQEPCRCHH